MSMTFFFSYLQKRNKTYIIKQGDMMKQDVIYNKLLREDNLSIYACKDQDAIRFDDFVPDNRPNYFRDIDRIIHSMSYARYMDKTQVFTKQKNNHITKRMLHVQFVSKIARHIGRALSLNEDLIEAIALGHDVGHVPYGHVGEKILDKISHEYNEGNFMHNVQSVRTLMNIEREGEGLNLCVQVLDGILCHNGEEFLPKYEYKDKTPEEFLDDYKKCYNDKKFGNTLLPMTLEGCVVRVSDGIAYIGRDFEDAMRLGIINRSDFPKDVSKIIGDNNDSIINIIIKDIIANSIDKNYIAMSKEIYEAMNKLKSFNYEAVYSKANTEIDIKYVEEKFRVVFDAMLKELKEKDKNSDIYKIFLKDKNKKYLNETSDVRIVIDYIAGMTDEFFEYQYDKISRRKSW